MRGPTSTVMRSSARSVESCTQFSQPSAAIRLAGMRLFANPGEQRRVPLQLSGQCFDGAQCRRADMMLHSFDVVVDRLLVEAEQFQEIGEKLMPSGNILRESLAGGCQ